MRVPLTLRFRDFLLERLRNGNIKPGFYYPANATTTTQKQSDYNVEQSSFTLMALL